MLRTIRDYHWIVYQVKSGQHAGARCVCTESEWEQILAKDAVGNILVAKTDSEIEAEKLARENSSQFGGRRKVRSPHYPWLGAPAS